MLSTEEVVVMSTVSQLVKISPFKLQLVMIALFGVGVFVGSGAIAYA